MTIIEINNLSLLNNGVKSFLPYLKKNKIFAFNANMGVGKTTFISELIKEMGYSDVVSSPTYSLINEYETSKYGICYHLDLYRIESYDEAIEIGIDEILYSNQYVFIEWASKINDFLPNDTLNIDIEKERNIRKLMIYDK